MIPTNNQPRTCPHTKQKACVHFLMCPSGRCHPQPQSTPPPLRALPHARPFHPQDKGGRQVHLKRVADMSTTPKAMPIKMEEDTELEKKHLAEGKTQAQQIHAICAAAVSSSFSSFLLLPPPDLDRFLQVHQRFSACKSLWKK